jgi:hypothetical protein
MCGSLPFRRTSGSVLVIVGDALAILALFSPWLRLYTTFGIRTAGEHGYGPWTLLSYGGDAVVQVAIGIFFPVAALVAGSAALLVVRGRRLRAILSGLALLLAIGCLIVTLFVLAMLPIGLSMTWPYFTMRGVEYGAWTALMGFACIALGVINLPAEG